MGAQYNFLWNFAYISEHRTLLTNENIHVVLHMDIERPIVIHQKLANAKSNLLPYLIELHITCRISGNN